MSGRLALPLVLASAALGLGAPALTCAADQLAVGQQRVFAEKPRIEDYEDYGSFLVDIMAFRKQREELAREQTEQPATRAVAPATPTNAQTEPLSPLARDPYRVRQPESLEEALERARYIKHPEYPELVRFQRTTSQSFPLEALDTPELSTAELPGMLADPATGQLAIYEDDAAEGQAKKKANESADGEDDRQTKADADSFAITSAGPESAGSNWAIDADGRRFYLQIGDRTNRYNFSYGSGDYEFNYLYVDLVVEHKQ